MEPLISVIVPVYNVEQYLKRCVNSIINQTYHNLEIILVDDGSTDNSPAICDDFAKKDQRIKVMHNINEGPSAARNAGIQVSQGDYIGFVDSDDWIAPSMYEYLLNIILIDDFDLAMCTLIISQTEDLMLPNIKENLSVYSDNDMIMDRFFRINGEADCNSPVLKLIKSTIVKDILFLEKIYYEDLEWSYRVFRSCNKCVFSNLPKYFYYTNYGSTMRSPLNEKDNDLLQVWDLICNNCKVDYPNKFIFSEINKYRANFSYLCKALLYGIDPLYKSSSVTIKKCIRILKMNYVQLLQLKMSIIKKILLTMICINYSFCQFLSKIIITYMKVKITI